MISPDLAFYTFFAFSCMPSIHFLFWILLLSVFKRSSFFQDFEEQNWMSMIILSWWKSTLYSQNAIATWKKNPDLQTKISPDLKSPSHDNQPLGLRKWAYAPLLKNVFYGRTQGSGKNRAYENPFYFLLFLSFTYIHTYTLFMLEIHRVAVELMYSRK